MDKPAVFQCTEDWTLDHALAGSCTGLGLKFPHLWELAVRYVKHGDDLHRRAGMKILADFAHNMPLDEAAFLIEQYFEHHKYRPTGGGKPWLDEQAFQAAVAIGLANDYISKREQCLIRRGRMVAVIARSITVMTDPEERDLAQRAFQALLAEDPSWTPVQRQSRLGILQGRRIDQELFDRCSTAVDERRWDDAVRVGMIVLENRLRDTTGAGLETVGVDLAVKAFEISSPLNFGQTKAEKEGLLNLFRSTFLLFRNPAAHRFAEHAVDRAIHVLTLVDLLLDLIGEANTRLYSLGFHLTPHEASHLARVERVLHLDLDCDGADERVLLFSDPTQSGTRSFGILVLQDAGSGLRRREVLTGFGTGESLRSFSGISSLSQPNQPGHQGIGLAMVTDRGGDQGILRIVVSTASAGLHYAHFQSEWPNSSSDEYLGIDLAAGEMEYKDANGDGQVEIHVQRSREIRSPDKTDQIRYTLTYQYDQREARFSLCRRSPFPGQYPTSDEARKFIASLI
jgi:uncharacterized protein (TIGR02391 family)